MFCVEVHNASKQYSHKTALSSVSVVFKSGEIHALLGENGAGKSTLAVVLAGKKQLSSGSLLINGKESVFHCQADALRHGIAVVPQRPQVAPALRVYENCILGNESPALFGFMSRRKALAEIKQIADRWNISLELTDTAGRLSASGRFYTALLSALYRKPSMLVLDEPAASLDAAQQQKLYGRLTAAARAGLCVVLITHNLHDAVCYADVITVLRKGAVAARFDNHKKNISCSEISAAIFPLSPDTVDAVAGADGAEKLPAEKNAAAKKLSGDKIAADKNTAAESLSADKPGATGRIPGREPADSAGSLLELCHVSSVSRGHTLFDDVSFAVRAGRITLITGKHEEALDALEDLLTGMERVPYRGDIYFCGMLVRFFSPRKLRRFGCGIIPSDKTFRGSFPSLTVQEMLSVYGKIADVPSVQRLIRSEQIDITLTEPVSNLSGGMLQRLILARELEQNPRLLLMFEPGFGLDSAATEKLADTVRSAAKNNAGVLIVAAAAEQFLRIADDVYVFKSGKLSIPEYSERRLPYEKE